MWKGKTLIMGIMMSGKSLILASSILILLSPKAEAWWNKYPSKAEAQVACRNWAKRGGWFTYDSRHPHIMPSDEVWEMMDTALRNEYLKPYSNVRKNRRSCEHERETRQLLGYEQGREGKHYQWKDLPKRRVKKRFSY